MSKGVFITGTDTGAGKTWFAVALMSALKKEGYQVAGMKPIASGAKYIDGKLINEDAQQIMENGSKKIHYDLVNPYVFELPIAPHLAAQQQKIFIAVDKIVDAYQQLAANTDIVVVEGVGGWRIPISDDASLLDVVCSLNIPVIMVVGMKLGCINHAILTAEAIRSDGVNFIGWVNNQIGKDYAFKDETICTLENTISRPHLAEIPFMTGRQSDHIIDQRSLTRILGFLSE